jgi:hypothetical protein
MATDGGQIRIAGKILAEQNHSKTVTSNSTMTLDKIAVGNGAKRLVPHTVGQAGILITNALGNATFVPVPAGEAGYNKLLYSNANSELEWVDKGGA